MTKNKLDKAYELRIRYYEIHHNHILKLFGLSKVKRLLNKNKIELHEKFHYENLDKLERWYDNMTALVKPKEYKKFLDHLEKNMNKK